MDSQIVAIYCLCDDILKGLKHFEDKQCRMSDAEVMSTSIVAALFFSGNMEKLRVFLQEHGVIILISCEMAHSYGRASYFFLD